MTSTVDSKIELEKIVFSYMNNGSLLYKWILSWRRTAAFSSRSVTLWDIIFSTISQFIIWLGILVGYFFFFIRPNVVYWLELDESALVFSFLILIAILAFYIGIKKTFQLQLYWSIKTYFNIKDYILKEDSRLNLSINNTRESINVSELDVFILQLKNLTQAYRKIYWPLRLVWKNTFYFSWEAKEDLDTFLNKERNWLKSYTEDLYNKIVAWLKQHSKNLNNFANKLPKVGNIEEKTILDANEKRLTLYIKSLEKMIVFLALP